MDSIEESYEYENIDDTCLSCGGLAITIWSVLYSGYMSYCQDMKCGAQWRAS